MSTEQPQDPSAAQATATPSSLQVEPKRRWRPTRRGFLIGLGASAPSYYGAVGERLGCEMILPEHAGVANAIGAVAGQVSQRLTGMVSSPAEGRFVAHLTAGPQVFSDRDVALEAMETALRAEAETRARAAGAVDLRVSVDRALKEVEIVGRSMFIEATVTVTASGRPRVAHG